jgi:sugar/nucleoside kinase (ribokinase family)
MIFEKIQLYWDKIQDLFDISGDLWMGLFTTAILARLLLVLKGYAPMTTAEAGTYGSAVLAFAYSNRGPRA